MEWKVAYHLGTWKRAVESEIIEEDVLFNVYETFLVADVNDGRTLAINGDGNVMFADVVRTGVGMTMIVMLGGGSCSDLAVRFIIF